MKDDTREQNKFSNIQALSM